MKKLLFIACFAAALPVFGQNALDEMIAAEKSFAAYAVANNTVDAFLKFMDTSAVMFRNGEPYKAYADWQKREKRQGILNWWPTYAEISTGGDFGYTCGPWTFQPTAATDSIIGRGHFFTVWRKNKNGEWKFILDVGTDTGTINLSGAVTKIDAVKTAGTKQSLLQAEDAYHRLYKRKEMQSALNFFLPTTIVNAKLDGQLLQRKDEVTLPVEHDAGGFYEFTHLGSGLAPGADLGYTFGSVTHSFTTKKETYLRIWRHDASGWKIALQMIRPVPMEKRRQ